MKAMVSLRFPSVLAGLWFCLLAGFAWGRMLSVPCDALADAPWVRSGEMVPPLTERVATRVAKGGEDRSPAFRAMPDGFEPTLLPGVIAPVVIRTVEASIQGIFGVHGAIHDWGPAASFGAVESEDEGTLETRLLTEGIQRLAMQLLPEESAVVPVAQAPSPPPVREEAAASGGRVPAWLWTVICWGAPAVGLLIAFILLQIARAHHIERQMH